MYKDKNFQLFNNLIYTLEEKENNLYWPTEEKMNKNISTVLKEWCRIHNFIYVNINNSHIINCKDNFYLISSQNTAGNGEIIIEKCRYSNNYGVLKIKKLERPIITSTKKLYKFIRDIKKELENIFVERIELKDFLYCNDLDKYCLLSSFKDYLYEYNEEIKISAINLFFGKSPYLYKGNEINTMEELKLLKEQPNGNIFNNYK